MIVVNVLLGWSELPTTVPQNGEAVKVDAVRLSTFIGLQHPGQSHCLVVVHDGNGGALGRGDVKACFVVVND